MNTKKTMSIIAIAAAGLTVSTAYAGGVAWDGSESSSWSDPDNWTPSGVPDAADDVVINAVGAFHSNPQVDQNATVNSLQMNTGSSLVFGGAYTLTVDGGAFDINGTGTANINQSGAKIRLEAADAIQLESSAFIKISAGAELEVVSASSSGHVLNGQIQLLGSGSLLDVQDNNTFTGSGSVVGSDDAAKVAITAGKIFTSQVDLTGAMLFDGLSSVNPGTLKLDNGAMVHANVSGGVIEFTADTLLDDSGTSDAEVFKVSNGSELMFSKTATNLDAAFVIDGGTFDFNQDIATTGDLTCSGSPTIEVDTNKMFTWLSGSMNEDSLDDSGSPYTTCP